MSSARPAGLTRDARERTLRRVVDSGGARVSVWQKDNNGKAPPMTTTATRRTWLGLAVLALPTLLLSLDVSVLYLALPHAQRRPRRRTAPSSCGSWTSTSFMLAGFLVTMGTLGDRIGRRRLLLIGAAAFGVASVAGRVLDQRRRC